MPLETSEDAVADWGMLEEKCHKTSTIGMLT